MAFHVSKILAAFVMPPGLYLVVIAVLLGVTWPRRSAADPSEGDTQPRAPAYPRSVRALLWGLLALVYLTSISPTRTLLVRPLEMGYPPLPADARPDSVVVLGGGLVAGSPEAPDGASPTKASLKRLRYALELADRLDVPIVTSGGDPYDETDTTEADLMARELVALGAPPAMVTAEARSGNTMQSARRVSELLEVRALTTPALVTSARHMPRAAAAFRKRGVDVLPAPTDYTSAPAGTRIIYAQFLPSADNLALLQSALHEYVGMAYYRLLGGV